MPSLLESLLLSSLVVNLWSNGCALGHVTSSSSSSSRTVSSEDYINSRWKQTKRDSQAPVADDDAWTESSRVIEWKNLRSTPSQSQQPRAVNLFDEAFIIDERRQVLSDALNLDDDNDTPRELQLNLSSPNQPIKFIKSYFRSDQLSLLIVCQWSCCTHYQAVKGDSSFLLQHEQSIDYPAHVPIDAAFFTHAGKPHLVIAYDSDSDHYSSNELVLPSSKIYQWNGRRMVCVDDIAVASPRSVVAIHNDLANSTLVLFTVERDDDDDDATGPRGATCVIYQLNADDHSIRRVRSANMDDVASIYPYNYANQQFLLTIDATGSAEILRWNAAGQFESLAKLPDIQPALAHEMRTVPIDKTTLLFVSRAAALCVYKLEDKEAKLLAELALVDGQRVVEITAWKYEDAIMLLLVKVNAEGTFQTELWQLNLGVDGQTDVVVEANDASAVRACLRQLKDALDSRASAIQHFQIARSLNVADLVINGGSISLVEFREKPNATVANPRQTREKFRGLRQKASALKDKVLKIGAILSGNVSVVGETTRIEELHIDSVEASYINGKRADLENYLISGIDQQFSRALKAKKVSVDELSVASLCGYGFDHWMQVNDSARSSIANLRGIDGSSITIVNDTIVIESDLTARELNTRRINGIDWKDFLDDLFIIGKQQRIVEGGVRYEGIVQVLRLYSDKVNNVSSSDLITKPSNQSLRDVFVEALQVERLHVEKINGVRIGQAARMSRENVIKGKLTMAKLVITDELSVKENIAIPLTHPTQDYDRVHIDGDVFLSNLELGDLNLGGEAVQPSLRDLVAGSWTRSTDQLIEAPVSLRKGASIDRLDCLHLNGLAEHDFLYSDSAQLADLENVTFANFHAYRRILGSSPGNQQPTAGFLVEETSDRLTFRRAIRMRHLAVDTLFAANYNGIPIESIMLGRRPSDRLPNDFEFETVRVDAEMSVDELRASRVNSRSVVGVLEGALLTDGHASIAGPSSLGSANLSVASPHASVGRLNGRDLNGTLADLEELLLLLLLSGEAIEQLTIEDGVAIEGHLQVDRINDEEASDHVSRMRVADPSSLTFVESLVNLTVVESVEVELLLNGRKLDAELFAGALSRSKQQTLDGPVAFVDAQIDYLTAGAINHLDLSKLTYVDEPAVIRGNVSFSHLYVDAGRVTSQTFNGHNVSKLESKLRRLPSNRIDNLLVQADVRWDEPSGNSRSLARLLDKAVTKHEHQLVDGPIAFDKPVLVESLQLGKDADSEICRKISEIIADTVVDSTTSSDPITVRGTKIFKRGLTAGDLQVDGNIDIERVNGLDIRRVSSRIFQRDKTQLVTAHLTFLDSVEIARLIAETNVHGVALQELAVVGQRMPKSLDFQELHVDGELSLHKLDGIDFDDFVKHRVTVDQDNEIFADARFMHSVRVLNGTEVASINQVVPENLAENKADGIPIMLRGNKVFRSKLTVEQDVETALINDFQVDSIYDNALLNGTNADVLGTLVFEGGVEMYGNMSVSGEINGMKVERPSEKTHLPNRLSKAISLLNSSVNEIDKETRTFAAASSRVLYLEEERKLNWHFAAVQSVKSPRVKNKTRLEIVTAEVAELCASPSGECLCRKQYNVDVLPSGEYDIQEQNVSNSFYLAEGPYGLKIISRSTSQSEQCSKSPDDEDSMIFWFKFHEHREILKRTPALHVNGHISDARVFQIDDQLYLIIAVFYDKQTRAHATDSLLYQFDLTNGQAHLVQRIPTDGAKSINLFQVANVGMHALIGCVKGRAESLLLRFDPSSRQFQMIRTFATGGSKYLASVGSNEQTFVILSNPDVRALQIFNYEDLSDTFVDYQNLFFESRVTSLGVFYSGDFGQSDAFVVTTTKDGWLYIYEYMFYGKFQQKMSYWADDIQVLTPFRHMSENYLFAGFKFNSTVYKVIQQGN